MGCSRAHCAATHVHHQVWCLVIWWVHIYQYAWVSSMWAKLGGAHCHIASILHQYSPIFCCDTCEVIMHGGFSFRSCDVGALVRCADTISGPTQPGSERQGKRNIWNTLVHTRPRKTLGVIPSTAVVWPPSEKAWQLSKWCVHPHARMLESG